MSKWSKRQKIGAVVGIAVHAVIVWQVWEISKLTPRPIQVINCAGEIEFEGEFRDDTIPVTEKDTGISI